MRFTLLIIGEQSGFSPALHLTVFCQLYIAGTIRARERVCDEAAGLCHSTPRAGGHHAAQTAAGHPVWGCYLARDRRGGGEFLGATGDIASIIAVSATDEVVDNYDARMILP
jgi:hypothetical protein